MKKLLIFVLFSISILSCKVTKKQASDINLSEADNKAIIGIFQKNNIDFEYAKIKSNAESGVQGLNLNLDVEVRMKKNDYIWVVVKKFGIEGARMLIRYDSLFFLDRINSNYYARDFQSFVRDINISISFEEMQDLIIGNLLVKDVKIENKSMDDKTLKVETSNEKYSANFEIDDQLFVIFAKYTDINKSTLSFSNSRFEQVENAKLPFKRWITLSDEAEGDVIVELEIKSIEINKKHDIKFDIPSHYVKK